MKPSLKTHVSTSWSNYHIVISKLFWKTKVEPTTICDFVISIFLAVVLC
uniref:Uncharacterized protein n=1 Tax=Rhizophora mucronata TaxID=61149 RepID=A0A2P2NJ96_RHIMU